jgi:kynurenine formamidase
MSSSPPSMSPLAALTEALASGAVRVMDLTQPLSESTPVLRLPEPFANTPGLTRHELSRYDERGPAWAWSWLEIGEHVGTHFDAPIHWITGRDGEDVATSRAFTGTRAREHPDSGWLLLRTGWGARAHDQEEFLNADESGPHTPGVEAECARWLAHETPIVGIGVETVGTDAGGAAAFDPPFPVHSHFLGAGKYGLTQLANLAQLPPTGAVIIVAPLKLVEGTGTPTRVLALV